MHYTNISNIRREYGTLYLTKKNIHNNPIEQFKIWFQEILKVRFIDPTAMVLSTIDEKGFPDSRVVLLKDIQDENFIFYTNYHSNKAIQLKYIPYVALNFYWPEMSRQIKIKGYAKQIKTNQYFLSRPMYSQISAIISPQSQYISDRLILEKEFNKYVNKDKKIINLPNSWGGYQTIPSEFEFWQGRNNRLHDRILYKKINKLWKYYRLAP